MNVMCPSCPGYARSLLCQSHACDGVTNYQVEDTEEEKAKRLRQWEKFLEEDGEAEDKELGTGQTATRNRATCAYTMVFLFYT